MLLYRLLHLLIVGSFFRIMSKASCIASISFISCFPPTMCRVIIPIIYGLVSQVVINRALMSGPHLEQGRGRQEGGRRGDSCSFPPQENLTYLIHLLTYHCEGVLLFASLASKTHQSQCELSVCMCADQHSNNFLHRVQSVLPPPKGATETSCYHFEYKLHLIKFHHTSIVKASIEICAKAQFHTQWSVNCNL